MDPLVFSIEEAAKTAKVCRQTIYNEINAGRLQTFKIGSRRLISRTSFDDWIRGLEKRSTAA